LKWLKNAAALDKTPNRIEAYDISNLGGEDRRRFHDGFCGRQAFEADYRRFKIQDAERGGRLRRHAGGRDPQAHQLFRGDEKFAALPDLSS
jgi:excinuclease UvrABC nuclease subunit